MRWTAYLAALTTVGGMGLLISGCDGGKRQSASPPIPPVYVQQPIARIITNHAEFTGTTVAAESVELRARVKGFLEKVNFQPGVEVKQGDLLFVIDPKPYEASLAEAKANLAAARAENERADAEAKRIAENAQQGAASEFERLNSRAIADAARAAVAAAEAKVDQATLNLGYTHVYAPISGRIDRNMVDVGNLVGAQSETLLATIVRLAPMYAYFSMSERELLTYMELRRSRTAATSAPTSRPEGSPERAAFLSLANEEDFPHRGEIDYGSNRVDPDTGTIELRGVFPNEDRRLVPGLFVRVRIPMGRQEALLVPSVALGRDQGGRYLLTVDDANIVQFRRVTMGPEVGRDLVAVTEGLQAGDWVVVNGIQRARPGSTVDPKRQHPPERAAATQPAVSEAVAIERN